MDKRKVVVVDYGMGNVFSVMQALDRLGVVGELTSEPVRILGADRVILPGVGAFGRAADKLRSLGLDEAILQYVATGKPFMGICVGMQLLMSKGEEFGTHAGLGIIPGTVRRISARSEYGSECKIPLIGWVSVERSYDHAWIGTPFDGIGEQNAFYFVHSFQADVENAEHCIAVHRLGDQSITSAVRYENVLGVQFHPERSALAGQRFLDAFIHGANLC
jgi:glutamine amidotransferase